MCPRIAGASRDVTFEAVSDKFFMSFCVFVLKFFQLPNLVHAVFRKLEIRYFFQKSCHIVPLSDRLPDISVRNIIKTLYHFWVRKINLFKVFLSNGMSG